MGSVVASQAFLPPPVTYNDKFRHLSFIGSLPIIYLDFEGAGVLGQDYTKRRYTLLFSHGNAEDLGCVVSWLKVVRDRCRVNVLAYEYRGYGLNPGAPSELQCYQDAMTAYKFLIENKGCCPSTIILFGRSLGSGPTVHLASELYQPFVEQTTPSFWTFGCSSRSHPTPQILPPQQQQEQSFDVSASCIAAAASSPSEKAADTPPPAENESSSSLVVRNEKAKFDLFHPIGGVILQSPLLSAISVVSCKAAKVLKKIDVFSNINKIEFVHCPLLILHGCLDEVVPFSHGELLSKKAPNLYRFVSLEDAGHNDIEEKFGQKFIASVVDFLSEIDRRVPSTSSSSSSTSVKNSSIFMPLR